jgi:hypothetical protein
MGGISLVVVERAEGVQTRKMSVQGVWASGTSYVTLEDVKVPVGNLLGKENKGFPVRSPVLPSSSPLSFSLSSSLSPFPALALMFSPSDRSSCLTLAASASVSLFRRTDSPVSASRRASASLFAPFPFHLTVLTGLAVFSRL